MAALVSRRDFFDTVVDAIIPCMPGIYYGEQPKNKKLYLSYISQTCSHSFTPAIFGSATNLYAVLTIKNKKAFDRFT